MRVLHVIKSLILAGVEVLIREMVPRQRERGLDVSVAVLKELDSPLEPNLRDMGTPFVKLPRLKMYDPRRVLALRLVVGQYDVVQASHIWRQASDGTMLPLRHGCDRLLSYIHGHLQFALLCLYNP